MKYFTTPLLCSLLLLVALACNNSVKEESHDLIMRAKIAKFELAEHNFTISRATRRVNAIATAKELSKEYPAAPPFPKDTTDSIFVANLPKTIRGIPLAYKNFVYEKPAISELMKAITGMKSTVNKPYYIGRVDYKKETKRGKIGAGIMIFDFGYNPEWTVTYMFDQLYKDESARLADVFAPGFEFDRKLDYKGHTWGVWIPGTMLQRIMTRNQSPGLTVFATQWNSRFVSIQIDSDTSAANLEVFHQIVNVPWLSKLRSPERQKHVMPN